jgi:tetratricopeptide (TPR) repeat protein
VSAADLARVEESLGDVCERAGLFDRGAEAITHARRLSGVGGSSIPRLLRKQGNVAERSGRFSRALRWYGRGIRAAEELGFDQERIELLMARASALYWQSRYREVTRLCEQVVEESSAIGYRGSALAHAYYLLHLAHTNLVSPERVRYRELALPIYEELGDLAGAAKVYNNLGIDAYYEGDWDEARRLYERARDAHERVGNEVFAADCINNIAEILSDQGHLREAEPLLSEVAEIYRAAGERAGIAYAEGNLGRLAARAGRAAEGLARLEEAARTFEQLRSRTELVMTQARISECLLLLERPADAFERADTSLRRAIAQGEGPAIVSMLHRVLGYAEAQLGERDQALDELVEAERVAREGDVPFELVLALEARGRLLPGGPERIRLRKEAEAIFARLGVHSTLGVPMPEGMST